VPLKALKDRNNLGEVVVDDVVLGVVGQSAKPAPTSPASRR
jgi:hypothetical protein